MSVVGVKAFVLGVEDKNNDGILDRDELTQAHFDSLDKDGDGGIDSSEFLHSVDHVDPQPNPMQGNPGGWSMLHYAANGGRLEVVQFLFSAGADINLRDYDNQSPLMLAQRQGHDEVVNFLKNPDWSARERFRIRMYTGTEVDLWQSSPSGQVHVWHGHSDLRNFAPKSTGFSLTNSPSYMTRGYY